VTGEKKGKREVFGKWMNGKMETKVCVFTLGKNRATGQVAYEQGDLMSL
jgi:hypothetical protein